MKGMQTIQFFARISLVIILAVSMAACAIPPDEISGASSSGQPGEGNPNASGAGGQAGDTNPGADGSGIQPLSGGGPSDQTVEGTPQVSNDPRSGSSGDSGGFVTSDGKTVPASPGNDSNRPGTANVGDEPGSGPSGDFVEWPNLTLLIYRDEEYDFSLSYPDFYVVQLGAMPGSQMVVAPVHVVRFQDKALAEGETADLEPPQFMIEIFKYNGETPLKDWVIKNQFAPNTATFESITKDGSTAALKVTLATMLAPNSSNYYVVGRFIYRVTPMGPYSEQMLASLNLDVE